MMLDAKASFNKIKQTIVEIFDNTAKDIRLEEVEFSYNKENCELIVSFLLPDSNKLKAISVTAALASAYEREYERVYKKFIINRATGNIESMKIYDNKI